MLELVQSGYFPLDDQRMIFEVPGEPGVYLLSVCLANGVHHAFFASQTDNLRKSIRKYAETDLVALPESILGYLLKYRCYYSYFVVPDGEGRKECQKIVSHTLDPLSKLTIINCN